MVSDVLFLFILFVFLDEHGITGLNGNRRDKICS